jgi:predicted RNase H-like HicB family nuclease
MRQVIIYPGEDNMWVAECPSLHGCISQGDTKESAIENIKEAIKLYIDALKEDNLPIPEEKFNSILIAV